MGHLFYIVICLRSDEIAPLLVYKGNTKECIEDEVGCVSIGLYRIVDISIK